MTNAHHMAPVNLANLSCDRYFLPLFNPQPSLRFLCRPTAFFSTCWSCGTSESSIYGKQRIFPCNSALAHFHVSWLSDFIFYPKPIYKSLHQSFFYSFITILPSESGVTLHYSTILPWTIISPC